MCFFRIALNIKNLQYEYKAVNLLKKEQLDPDFLKLNPSGELPVLVIGDHTINQSVAILEHLEENYTEGDPLLPKDPVQRAQVREIVQIIASDTQPVQNLRVINMVQELTGSEDAKKQWAKEWITRGIRALERTLERTAGKFAVGDQVTMADICIVPQLYNARRFGVDLEQFPITLRINEACSLLPVFEKAHPDNQPDAVQ